MNDYPYIEHSRYMDNAALDVLEALSQETWFKVVRLLVRADPWRQK
ncbi:MAG: hypothetical protein P8M18_11145 [Woeseiaceae bacterium]|nr:hypothetical protein [Woeseiaceae bacterium]